MESIMKFFRLNKQLKQVAALRDAMSDRLHEAQVQIEVMAQALDQKDAELMAFVGRLHENMGGELRLESEGDALARLRVIRAQAEMFTAIMDVIEGRYDADQALLKRVACALGISQFDVNSVISQAGRLAGAHSRELALIHKVKQLEEEIEELETINTEYE